MSQPTITSFFTSRKRAATDDVASAKTKVQVISETSQSTPRCAGTNKNIKLLSNKKDVAACVEAASNRHKRSRAVAKLSFEDKTQSEDTNSSPIPPHDELQTPTSPKIAQNPTAKNADFVAAFMKKQSAVNIAKNAKDGNVVTESRKELSLGDLKAKLLSSPRLAELKASANRFSRSYQLLKDNANLKEFKSIDVEIPTSPSKRSKVQDGVQSPKKVATEAESTPACDGKPLMSPRKVVISPVKSPSKVPAYIRHASLATNSTSLPLPHHYRSLAEIFRGMEQVVSLLFNRKEKITFAKLRPSVQEMLKKNFTVKHLEQIKKIAPEMYSFEVEKIKAFSASTQKQMYDLLIIPIFAQGSTQMGPKELLERRRKFFDRLTNLVKQHHSLFLSKLDPPMKIPDEKLARWHPEFELEKVPEVEQSKLPEMPGTETYSTAEDVLSKAKELFSCNTRMERALEKLAEAKARGLTEKEKLVTGLSDPPTTPADGDSPPAPSTSNVVLINPALRNLPASLLEKIKAKQAAKALEAMTRTTEDDKKYLIYSRLPDLARTLRNVFVTERKNVLALNVVLSKLDSSFQGRVSELDLRGDIEILSKEVPDWISLQLVRNIKYLKLNRDANLENIKQKLQALSDKYKK